MCGMERWILVIHNIILRYILDIMGSCPDLYSVVGAVAGISVEVWGSWGWKLVKTEVQLRWLGKEKTERSSRAAVGGEW